MGNPNRISGLGMLALGLGVGAALAASPIASAGTLSADGGAGALGVASALALTDIGDAVAGIGAAGAITPPTLPDDYANFAVSFSGITLWQSGTAVAGSTFGNFAIAQGDHAGAISWHGLFNYASATGDHSVAYTGGDEATGFFNSATAVGTYSAAEAAFANGGGTGNVASATGDYAQAYAGVPNSFVLPSGDYNMATAQGLQTFAYASPDGSSNNVASAIGDHTTDLVPSAGSSAADTDLFGDSAGTDFWSDLWHVS